MNRFLVWAFFGTVTFLGAVSLVCLALIGAVAGHALGASIVIGALVSIGSVSLWTCSLALAKHLLSTRRHEES